MTLRGTLPIALIAVALSIAAAQTSGANPP